MVPKKYVCVHKIDGTSLVLKVYMNTSVGKGQILNFRSLAWLNSEHGNEASRTS